jgi:23S rRNA pseudouridine1911/1915/1917 synthase
MQIETLFEDNMLLVVNKPSGLLTQASVDKKRPDLFSLLQKKYSYLALHHRLDVGTSGVLLLCKDKNYNKEVQDLFKSHTAQKYYKALCYKIDKKTRPAEWVVENHLGLKENTKNKVNLYTAVDSGGDYAKTVFKNIKEDENKILVEAKPITGRTHQIRVHLFEMRLPIFGDTLYKRRDVPPMPRLMLHAERLEFPHPISKELVSVTAPLPSEFLF